MREIFRFFERAARLPAEDYEAIYDVSREVLARNPGAWALEFGPGTTTRALFDAGFRGVFSLEHDPHWFEVANKKLRPIVPADCSWHLWFYENAPTILLPKPLPRCGLGIVDSPSGTKKRIRHPGQEECSRYNTLTFALAHCEVVLLHDCDRPGELASVEKAGRSLEMLTLKLGRIV